MITILRGAVDAFVREDYPNLNFGGFAYATLSAAGGARRWYYVFFPTPEPGAEIAAAPLRLWIKSGFAAGPYTFTVRRISEPWTEDKITWNNRPAVAGAIVAENVGGPLAANSLVLIDIADLAAEAASGQPSYGVRVEIDTGTGRIHSAEADDAAFHPELELDWSTKPDAPTDINPSGGQAVAVTHPVASWTFADPDGDEQDAFDYQLDDADDFAAPLWAPGWIVDPASQYDLAGTGFGGLVAATTYYQRVRARDESGVVSPWSDVVSFVYVAPGVLTITNPPAAPGNTVEETTPPITWNVAGAVQTKYRVRIFSTRVADGEDPELFFEVYDSKIQTSAVASHTIPAGVIVSETETYLVQVRVWDATNRVATAGVPVYLEAEREFTFERTGVAAAVTSLTVTTDDTPAFTLQWDRAATPDYFAVRVDDEIFTDRIDPEDVRVDADTYRMILWEVPPGEHTFEVEPVVISGGKLLHTPANPTQVATSAPTDAWLIMPSRDLYVGIYSPDTQNLIIGEEGTTFLPAGAQVPVRRVGAIRGNEGTITGRLRSQADRNTFEQIKSWARRGNRVVLVHGQRAYPVVLGPVGDPPVAGSNNRWFQVSVEIWQTGRFPIKDRR
jgi:hypothetical protein